MELPAGLVGHAGGQMMADIQVSASTFYVTTGTHGAHVLGGIVILTYMTFKAMNGGYLLRMRLELSTLAYTGTL